MPAKAGDPSTLANIRLGASDELLQSLLLFDRHSLDY